jgi:hypothetical protein
MSKIEESRIEEIITDKASKVIKSTESIALQVVDSAAVVMKAGLANMEDIGIRLNDMFLNTARRAINAGSTIGNDVRDVAKGAIHIAVDVGSELKDATKAAVKHDTKVG